MTRIGNETSSEIESRRGGPQGASLTSTLALVILLDINLFIEETSLESYCDDNTLTASADSLEKAIEIAQKDSENIIKKFRLNILPCNGAKSEVLALCPNPRKPKTK